MFTIYIQTIHKYIIIKFQFTAPYFDVAPFSSSSSKGPTESLLMLKRVIS